MRWNTSEYSDIKDIRIPPAQLWKPDILMYNRSVFLHAILYVSRLHWQNPFVWCLFVNISLLLLIRLGYKWLQIITCVMLVMVSFLADQFHEDINLQILLIISSESRTQRTIPQKLLKMLDFIVVNVPHIDCQEKFLSSFEYFLFLSHSWFFLQLKRIFKHYTCTSSQD